jgi:hypothetical protein
MVGDAMIANHVAKAKNGVLDEGSWKKNDKIVETLMLVFMIAGIVITDSILTSFPLPGRSAAVWAFRWW